MLWKSGDGVAESVTIDILAGDVLGLRCEARKLTNLRQEERL